MTLETSYNWPSALSLTIGMATQMADVATVLSTQFIDQISKFLAMSFGTRLKKLGKDGKDL